MALPQLKEHQAPSSCSQGGASSDRLGAPWYPSILRPPRGARSIDAATERRIHNTLTLTQQMRAPPAVTGRDVVSAGCAFANEYGIHGNRHGPNRSGPWYRRRIRKIRLTHHASRPACRRDRRRAVIPVKAMRWSRVSRTKQASGFASAAQGHRLHRCDHTETVPFCMARPRPMLFFRAFVVIITGMLSQPCTRSGRDYWGSTVRNNRSARNRFFCPRAAPKSTETTCVCGRYFTLYLSPSSRPRRWGNTCAATNERGSSTCRC